MVSDRQVRCTLKGVSRRGALEHLRHSMLKLDRQSQRMLPAAAERVCGALRICRFLGSVGRGDAWRPVGALYLVG